MVYFKQLFAEISTRFVLAFVHKNSISFSKEY